MDYEKKYKAALNWMKDVYPTLEGAAKEDANHYFPELAESEDEKIKRNIIAALIGEGYYDCDLTNECIAWLEKQGKQKPFDYENATIQQTDFAPKVEPQFHKGDWIIHNTANFVFKVINVGSNGYEVVNRENYKKTISFDNEDNYHLWTITDAKDGNVLHSPSHYLIWIYKDNEHYHACVNMNYVTENVATDGLISIPNDACPATRVQRSILFQKMEEANYKWDAEKKELKKIEQMPQRTVSAEAKEAMYDKPAWSEVDENHVFSITQTIFGAIRHNVIGHKTGDMQIDWLKSLKERVQQPKQEWKPSDEQLEILDMVLSNESMDDNVARILRELREQLKKLREE